MTTNEELIDRIDAALRDKDKLHHVRLDRALEEAAQEYATDEESRTVSIIAMWAFKAGAQWQRNRKPLLGEDHED